jgi:hypothetical protein
MSLSFRTLAIGVVALGILIGVAFGAGVAYGRGDPQTVSEGLTQQQIQQLYGPPTNPAAAQGGAQAGGGAAQALARSTTGRVTSVEGNTVTIETSRGSQKVTLGASGTVTKSGSGNLSDLTQGTTIFASGTRKDDGSFDATSISQVSGDLQALLAALTANSAAGGSGGTQQSR